MNPEIQTSKGTIYYSLKGQRAAFPRWCNSGATHTESIEILDTSSKEYKLHPHVTWTMVRFQEIIDRELVSFNLTQEEYSSHPGELVRAKIEFKRPCCIEAITDYPRLSKFVIREMNRVVACGKYLQIMKAFRNSKIEL